MWLGNDRLVVSVEREDTSRLAVLDVADAWPQRLCAAERRRPRARTATSGAPPSRPTGATVAFVFTPRHDLQPQRDPRRRRRDRRGAGADRDDRIADKAPAGRPTARRSRSPRSAAAGTSSTSSRADGSGERQLTPRRRRLREPRWSAGRRHDRGRPRPAQPLRPRHGRRRDGRGDGRRRGRRLGSAAAGRRRARCSATYEDARPQPPSCASSRGGQQPTRSTHPRRAPSARRRTCVPEDVTYTSFDGREIHGVPVPAAGASAERPVPAVVYPHGGPTELLRRRVGRARAVLRRQGLRLARDQLPRLDRATAATSSGSTTASGASTTRRTASPRPTTSRTLDWVDGDRLGIFGASYGSYMALLAVTDDPEHRFRCAVLQVRRLRRPHVLGAGRPRRGAGHASG